MTWPLNHLRPSPFTVPLHANKKRTMYVPVKEAAEEKALIHTHSHSNSRRPKRFLPECSATLGLEGHEGINKGKLGWEFLQTRSWTQAQTSLVLITPAETCTLTRCKQTTALCYRRSDYRVRDAQVISVSV